MQKHMQGLTPDQRLAVNLLAIGMNIKETARALGTSASAVSAWVNHNKAFKYALAARKRELLASYASAHTLSESYRS
ncbi:MAG TPA: helix-turn-helix domain-containing protein [Blastocatellia bacterium]|jgi:DNA-directed RNA polymerase specialized sigma24 family protein|nr:helix-turn-helix domain-containing protein [Blastocatellia bacterium]